MKKTNPNERNIKPEVLNKTLKYLNHIQAHLLAHKGIISGAEKIKIANNYGQSYSIFFAAVRCGYIVAIGEHFRKSNDNKWEVKVIKFEPIHARTVLSNHYDRHEENRLKRIKEEAAAMASRNNDSTVNLTKRSKNPLFKTRKNIRKPLVENSDHELGEHVTVPDKRQPKTFSLLWGLFKFNW